MTVHQQELIQLLKSNYLFYQDEIGILGDGCNLPPMIKETVKVDKIGSQTYVINYNFFNRMIEHILSFDSDEISVMQYLMDGHRYDEVHTNILIGNSGLNGQRNIYGCVCGEVVSPVDKVCDLQISKITKDNMDVLSQIKDEINQFESYDFLLRAVSDGGLDLYVAMHKMECVAYMHTNINYNAAQDKYIVSPTIYTCKSQRRKGIAGYMLSRIIKNEYSKCSIVYGTSPDNIGSNQLAQRVGLTYIGTKYRYGDLSVTKLKMDGV